MVITIADYINKITALEYELADTKKSIADIRLAIFGAGGPLNGNVMGYSPAQTDIFLRIAQDLGE